MKHYYRVNQFNGAHGENFTAIYCEDLGELAIENAGGIICTECDSLEEVLAGTPWEGAEALEFAADWPEMTDADFEGLSSASLRDWIEAKER